LTLVLKAAPLSLLLKQIENATSLKFRYATPPDATVSASFQNAPLFPTLDDALRPQGFSLAREGQVVWLVTGARQRRHSAVASARET
jgi:hypothetical protein